jgi:PhzF family phenazine biosynthesis protein
MMNPKIYQVDAFTSAPFAGNPAAVCLLESPQPAQWMLRVASEMNLSETAFLWPLAKGYSLRWFTPTTEVNLCGHATLASAHVLWESGILDNSQPAYFHTKSGLLTAVHTAGGIQLDFPTAEVKPAQPVPELLAALGIDHGQTWQAGNKLLIIVDNEEIVRRTAPDFVALSQLPGRGVIVSSAAQSNDYDFVSRYFAPWVGIDEDPVTGSAHCILGPFWAKQLGKTKLRAFQASTRGGALEVEPDRDRVYLRGQAVTILSGELHT